MREGWKRGAAPAPIKRNRSPSGLPRVLGAGTDARSGCPRPRRRSPAGLRLERNQSTCGLQAGQAVVKAIRCVSNLTRPVSWLGPASSGVYPHTKGTRCFTGGHRYRIPSTASGLLAPRSLAASRAKASGDRSRMDGSTSISGIAASAIRWSNDILALQAVIGLCRTRTPLQKGTRAGESRGAREVCPAVGSSQRGRGRLGRQFALGRRRRGLDASRLPAAASSTGCVPLQSG